MIKYCTIFFICIFPSLAIAGTGGSSLETTAVQIYGIVTGWGGKIAIGLFFGHALIRLITSGDIKSMVIALLIPVIIIFFFPALYNSLSAIV